MEIEYRKMQRDKNWMVVEHAAQVRNAPHNRRVMQQLLGWVYWDLNRNRERRNTPEIWNIEPFIILCKRMCALRTRRQLLWILLCLKPRERERETSSCIMAHSSIFNCILFYINLPVWRNGGSTTREKKKSNFETATFSCLCCLGLQT